MLNGTVGIQIGVGAFKLAYLSLSPPLSVSLSLLCLDGPLNAHIDKSRWSIGLGRSLG